MENMLLLTCSEHHNKTTHTSQLVLELRLLKKFRRGNCYMQNAALFEGCHLVKYCM